MLTEKKMHNLKVVDYVLLSGPIKDLSPEAATQTALREELFQRRKGESRIYKRFCNKNQVVGSSENYLKKNQISQLMNFLYFIIMNYFHNSMHGERQESGLTEFIPLILRASILILPSRSLSKYTVGVAAMAEDLMAETVFVYWLEFK